MKSIKSLIKALQKNYYLEFLIEPDSDLVDFSEHEVLVEYERANYYKKKLKVIDLIQNDVLKEVRDLYKKSLSELYIKLANTDAKNLNS